VQAEILKQLYWNGLFADFKQDEMLQSITRSIEALNPEGLPLDLNDSTHFNEDQRDHMKILMGLQYRKEPNLE